MSKKEKLLPPIHPGEILREEFLKPLALSAHRLAMLMRVPANRIQEIVNEKRGITPETAVRLGLCFGTTPEFWMNMQRDYELELLEDAKLSEIAQEVRPVKRASA